MVQKQQHGGIDNMLGQASATIFENQTVSRITLAALLLLIGSAVIIINSLGDHTKAANNIQQDVPIAGPIQTSPDVTNQTIHEIHQETNATAAPNETKSNSSVRATVNDQPVPVPENGTYSQTIENDDGTTSNISITNSQSSTGSTSNNSGFSNSFQMSTSNSSSTSTSVNTSTQFSSDSR